jgi:hypothetical protein
VHESHTSASLLVGILVVVMVSKAIARSSASLGLTNVRTPACPGSSIAQEDASLQPFVGLSRMLLLLPDVVAIVMATHVAIESQSS